MKPAFLFVLFALASATVFFQDDLSGADWKSRWVQSEKKPASERGELTLSAGKYFTNEAEESGLKTSQDARFYHYTTEFPEFSNKDNTLVLQYSLKQDQGIDCGGGYVKLHPTINQKKYNGDSPYNIMFGPDVCGHTKRIHVILTKNSKNHLIKTDIPLEVDTFTHVYTLILKSDNTFRVLVDNKEVKSGLIEDNFDILEPKQINDPSVSKPEDWVDEAQMDDPEDVKPEGYDDIPQEIDDPDAEKPEDWDTELDGEWEAPRIPNPEFKGPWKAARIANPAYKGPWVHPQIDNPAYKPDSTLYSFDSFKFLGIEIWQVKAGSVYDNFLVTDEVATAKKAAEKIITRVKGEKAGEEAAKAAEAAAEAAKEETDDDEEAEKEKTDL